MTTLTTYRDGPWAGLAALTEQTVERGRALYVGWYPSQAQAEPILRRVLSAQDLAFEAELPPGLVLCRRGPYTILLNFTDRVLATTVSGEPISVAGREVIMPATTRQGTWMTLKRPGRWYDAYIFDLDGTVYLGGRLLPTAGETLLALRARGKRTLFLSNNPTHTRDEYAERLTALGLPTPPADIVSSGVVMADFLKSAAGARREVVRHR